MLLSQKRLRVVINPFAVPLDHKGRPCAHVLYDPAHTNGQAVYIGSRLNRNVVEKRSFQYAPGQKQIVAGGGQQDRVDMTLEYDLAPVEIEDTRYHRKAIGDGVLIPADEKTAKVLGARFVEPKDLIASSMEKRVAEWREQTGDDPDRNAWKINAPGAPKAGDA